MELIRSFFAAGQEVPKGPVDIHFGKLTQFVLGNDALGKGWSRIDATKALEAAERQAEMLRRDLTDADLEALLSTEPFTYYECVEVLECLERKAGKNAKNWLGQYVDEQLLSWKNVVDQYERKNLFLFESSKLLERLMGWEIPFLRSQVSMCDKEHADVIKSISRIESNMRDHVASFRDECHRRGIQGVLLEEELQDACRTKLPGKLNEVLDMVQSEEVLDAVQYHDDFVHFMRNIAGDGDTPRQSPFSAVFEAQETRPISSISLTQAAKSTEVLSTSEQIVWDSPNTDEDQNLQNGSSNTGDIDWSTLYIAEESYSEQNGLGDNKGSAEQNEGTRGEETWIESARNRERLQLEMMELAAFYRERVREAKQQDPTAVYGFKSAPEVVRLYPIEKLQDFFARIQSILQKLEDPALLELVAIQGGGVRLKRMIADLERKAEMTDKFRIHISRLEEKSAQLGRRKKELLKQIVQSGEKVRRIQKNLESSISHLLNDRKTSILGVNL